MKSAAVTLAASVAFLSAASVFAADQPKVVDDPYERAHVMDKSKLTPAPRGYSPYAGRTYPTRPLFGDTHLHISNSGDAFMGGARLAMGRLEFGRRTEHAKAWTPCICSLEECLRFATG